MNNKGFTLVELLAVIVILVSISIVSVTSISSSLDRRDAKEVEEQQELAISAAKIYFSLSSNGATSVTVGTLKSENYFSNNRKTDKLCDGDSISIENGSYVYHATSC